MLAVERSNETTVLVRIFNDWESVRLLLGQLDRHLPSGCGSVMLVDDGSTCALPCDWGALGLERVRKVEVLCLRRNLGHQRAIAVGLCFLAEQRPLHAVLVMDGDGEDRPADTARLYHRFEQEGGEAVVFAARVRRIEGWVFRVCYFYYRYLHWILTGIPCRFGNFSVIPFGLLSRLVVVSDLWNHYPASILKARLPFVTVPTSRGARLAGRPKMNFVALLIHGLSAISVFSERVVVRLLVVIPALLVVLLFALACAVGVRLFTDLAIPGWATMATGILAILLLQLLTLMVMIVFLVLGGRDNAKVLPLRDYRPYVMELVQVWERHE